MPLVLTFWELQCISLFQSNDVPSYFPYRASALLFPLPYLSAVPAEVRLAIAGGAARGAAAAA